MAYRLFCFFILISFSSCYMARAYKFRKLNLNSHKQLPFVEVKNADSSFRFNESRLDSYLALQNVLDSQLHTTSTAAFLVIRNDSILYESYFDGYDKNSLLPSFSVAKSFVAALLGICYEEGKIRSLNDPFTAYLPAFLKKDKRFGHITIQQLLDMRSGLQWNEGDYGLKDDAIKLGFRPNMLPYIYKVKIKEPPGKFEYQSINTLLLSMIIEAVTKKSINQYLSEKIWQPMGMEAKATWNTDKRGNEITYSGLNATARDFAKLGRLYLNKGNWNGSQLISSNWIDSSTSPTVLSYKNGYANQFWGSVQHKQYTDSMLTVSAAQAIRGTPVRSYMAKDSIKQFYTSYYTAYYAQGILGQYVYVNPASRIIIVRLGYNWRHPKFSLYQFISSVSKELSN